MRSYYLLLLDILTVSGFLSTPLSLSASSLRPEHTSSSLHALDDKEDATQTTSTDSSTIFYNDFEQDIGFDTTPDLNLSELLQKRSEELRQSSRRLLQNWRSGKARSYGAFTINERYFIDQGEDGSLPFDWVRRVDIGRYPRVACGSAHGSGFVADVEAKKILGEVRGVHYSDHSDEHVNCLDDQLRQYIYGEYDGGGVLDVAMFGKGLVVSSGREGGVKIFRFLEGSGELVYEGQLQSLIRRMPGALPVIITCMKFDANGRLYLGGSDGFLRIVTFPQSFMMHNAPLNSDDVYVSTIPAPSQSGQTPSSILSLDISEQLGMVVTAHASGDACVYSIKEQEHGTIDAQVAGVWNPFSKLGKSHARSVTFVSMERRGVLRYAIVVGGGNGEMWISGIDPSHDTSTNERRLFFDNDVHRIQPNHAGPVIALASRPGGIVVSAGHDGILRITYAWLGRKDVKTPSRTVVTPLYGIGGCKVWIGSICIDSEGKHIVSDGMDDAVVVHNFSAD